MFRRSGATSIKMMAADLAPLAPAFTAPACSNSAVGGSPVNWSAMLRQEKGFAQRAVKMSSTTASSATIVDPSVPSSFGVANEGPRAVPGHAFVASLDGQRLGVGTGSHAVKSMRKYVNSNKLEDIHGGCDWAVLNCTATSAINTSSDNTNPAMSNTNATQFCISATQKGSTCSTTIVRGCSGHIAYASSPKTATVETNYFYAKPNDFVMLHSMKRAVNVADSSSSVAADAATAVFHRAIRHAARSNKSQTVDVESLAESVLDTFHQHGEEATVVIARLGEICPNAPQPPVTN